MKKLLILLLLITAAMNGQTPEPFDYGIQNLAAPTVTSTGYIVTEGTDHVYGKIAPQNITIPQIPINYIALTPTIGGHLGGVDLKLGMLSGTTAGISTRVWFTADQAAITAGTFDLTNPLSKGTAAIHQQTVANDDGQKKYFTTDLIGQPFTMATTFPKGTYAGNLSASTTPTNANQKFTVELYRCNNAGTPIASGVAGAPVGSLGVTVIMILDSGEVTLANASVTNVPVSTILGADFNILTGERIRYHVSAEKVGTAGGVINESVYYGTSYNSFIDVPVIYNSTSIKDVSAVTNGTGTVTDALNTLNVNKAELKTIAQIRALTGTLSSNNLYTTDIGQEGNWYYDASDTTSADNTGTILVTTDGKRIKRVYNGEVNIKWFGAKGDGIINDTSAINLALSNSNNIFIPKGTYLISSSLSVSGKNLRGEGIESIIKSTSAQFDMLIAPTGGCNLDYFKIDGGWNTTTAGQLGNGFVGGSIAGAFAGYIRIRNMYFLNCKENSIVLRRLGYSLVSNVKSNVSGLNGIVLDANSGSDSITTVSIDNSSTFSDCPNGFGVSIKNGTQISLNTVTCEHTKGIQILGIDNKNISITNCHQEVTNGGKFITTAGSYGTGLTVVNNYGDPTSIDYNSNWTFVNMHGNATITMPTNTYNWNCIETSGNTTTFQKIKSENIINSSFTNGRISSRHETNVGSRSAGFDIYGDEGGATSKTFEIVTQSNGGFTRLFSLLNSMSLSIGTADTERINISPTGTVKVINLAGTGTRQVVADASGNLSATDAAPTSGTYTPTLTNTLNVSGATLSNATYTRVGNIITVNVSFTVTATLANTLSQVKVSLPVTRTPATTIRVGNLTTVEAVTSSFNSGVVDVSSTTEATLYFKSISAANYAIDASFQYSVI